MIKGFEDYTGKYGFILASKDHKEALGDNGLLFTAEVLCLLCTLKPIHTEIEYQKWWDDLVKSCEIAPGNYARSPEHLNPDDQQGPDDMIGVAVASKFMGTKHAEDILKYGRHHDFVWKTHVKSKWLDAWLGRQLPLMAVFAMCAGETPNLFDRVALLISTILTTKENDSSKDLSKSPKDTATSNRLLASLIMMSLDNHIVSNITKWVWKRHMKELGESWSARWGLSTNISGEEACAKIYFEEGHPIVKLYSDVYSKKL